MTLEDIEWIPGGTLGGYYFPVEGTSVKVGPFPTKTIALKCALEYHKTGTYQYRKEGHTRARGEEPA